MPQIEFGQLQTDLPTYQNSGAIKVDGVIPVAKGYKSFPRFVALSGTGLTSSPVGLFTSFSAEGSTNYAGDGTKLYQMDNSLVFQDKSKAGGYTDKADSSRLMINNKFLIEEDLELKRINLIPPQKRSMSEISYAS